MPRRHRIYFCGLFVGISIIYVALFYTEDLRAENLKPKPQSTLVKISQKWLEHQPDSMMDCRELLNDKVLLTLYKVYFNFNIFHIQSEDIHDLDRNKEKELLYFMLGNLPSSNNVCLTSIEDKNSFKPWTSSLNTKNIYLLDDTGNNYYKSVVNSMPEGSRWNIKVLNVDQKNPDFSSVQCDVIVLSYMTSDAMKTYIDKASLNLRNIYVVLDNYKPDLPIGMAWDELLKGNVLKYVYKCDMKQEDTAGIAISKTV